MAKIPLRVYTHNIEKHIENHRTQEAIAHCKQILKFYPKHIDTYRLLGKAFLESQRYGEASDILQRVLSVVPDDFISQLGMSIIREDEGDLDGAIYHMERAFEVQPANGAIQEELRRLYGRRDGIQPPKIRLTRGALVRMYGRGELFAQAIAEAKAALAEDPERLDMQVLLSRLYYQSGDKATATEVSSRLVEKLPYCYEANHILAEVLASTSRPEDAHLYQERLRALDPYLAFVSDVQPTSADVPDNAVMVDELEYDPEQDEPARPGWTQQVGLAWDETPAKEQTPDWLAGELPPGESELQSPEAGSETESPAQPADIPEWMAAAGWKPSAGEEVETHLGFEDTGEDQPAPADMPDWLQELAPSSTEQVEETPQEAEEDTRWLEQILGPSTPVVEPAQETTGQPAVEADMPEWLRDLDAEKAADESAAPQSEAEMPDWIAMESGEPTVQAAAESTEETRTDWMPVDEGEPAAEPSQDIPGWLQELAQEPATEETPSATLEPLAAEEVETPAPPEIGTPVAEESAAIAPPEDMDAALAWLESLAARQGADEATLISQPDQRGAEMPEWLQKEADANAVEDAPAAPIEQATAPEAMEEAAPAEQDQVPAWLQEQPSETVSALEPAAEEESMPDWLREQMPAVNAEETVEDASVPDWLQEQPVASEEVEEAAAEASVPEWLQEQPQADSSEAVETTEETAAVPEWLQEQPQSASIEPVESTEETTIPEWLQELSVESEAVASEPQAESQEVKTELPEWLEIPAAEAVEMAEPAQDGVDLPEWLKEADEEAQVAATAEKPAHEPEPSALVTELQPEQPAAEAPNVPGDDIDAALAWLESLAAKQGADEDTLVTRPEDRLAAPPEWVQQAEEQAPSGSALEEASAELVSAEEAEIAQEITEEIPLPATEEVEITQDITEAISLPAAEEKEVSPAVPSEELEKTVEISAAAEQADTLGWVAEEEAPAEKTQPVRVAVDEPPAAPVYSEGVSLVDQEEEDDQEPLPQWLRGLGSYSADLEADLEEEENMAEWLPETDAYHERAQAVVEVSETESEITREVTPVEPPPAAVVEIPAPVVEEEAPDVTQPVTPAASLAELPERLQQAQTTLEKGDIDTALADYNHFIEDGELLEETIHDLRDALYRHPVNVDIWQSLGDAYMRSNRIQEALDAYTKAEELLR